jgi:hypothetical protein
MVVGDLDPGSRRTLKVFESLWRGNNLQEMWQRFNPQGELHLQRASEPGRALDYAAKTAKHSPVYRENMIMLPFC